MNIDKHGFNNVVRLGLDRIECMLELLGRPDRRLKFIHVAGTNGKGSVCAFMEAALIDAGIKVGKFTSPNLVRVNERIRVCGLDIEDKALEDVITRSERAASDVQKATEDAPTQFEIWCAAAMLYFAECECDMVLLEVGLGGEFDATNVIEAPEVCVICHIDIDHTAYLGGTIGEIAAAKCGIIKPTVKTKKVITCEQSPDAMAVIEARTAECGNELVVAKAPEPARFEGIHEIVEIGSLGEVKLGLGGVYQIANAALAYEALKAIGVQDEHIKKGFESARHPGRFEEIGDGVIFDGGHNPDGVRALDASLERYFPNTPMTVIYACMADKDVKSVLSILAKPGRRFIYTKVEDNPRAMNEEELAIFAMRECGVPGIFAPSLKSALLIAKYCPSPTVICGSLYLYADRP